MQTRLTPLKPHPAVRSYEQLGENNTFKVSKFPHAYHTLAIYMCIRYSNS